MSQHARRNYGSQPTSERQKASRRRYLKVVGAFLILLVAFAAGFALRSNTTLMASLGIINSPSELEQNPGMTVHGDTYESISARVAEVEGIITNSSLDTYELGNVTSSVLDSFVDSTEDSYLRYFTPERYAMYIRDPNAGEYGGVGVLFAEYEGNAYAADIFEGSLAQLVGVQEGDFVVAIDGERSDNWTPAEVSSALARDEGETVTITWRRPESLQASGGYEYTTTLECRTYNQTNVTTELAGRVGVIGVKQLTANSAELVSKAISELQGQGADAFVLDLRDCPGGYLTQAVDIADLFMKSGAVVQIQTKETTTVKNATSNSVTDKPLVVLVNENTAAAAEVLGAALQDSGRAVVVGTQTLGKGTVQVVRELSFGGALRYTAALYKTPTGRDLNGNGIAPDITVMVPETQKSVAIDTAAYAI